MSEPRSFRDWRASSAAAWAFLSGWVEEEVEDVANLFIMSDIGVVEILMMVDDEESFSLFFFVFFFLSLCLSCLCVRFFATKNSPLLLYIETRNPVVILNT